MGKEDEVRINISKLQNGRNFRDWQNDLRAYLLSKHLLHYLNYMPQKPIYVGLQGQFATGTVDRELEERFRHLVPSDSVDVTFVRNCPPRVREQLRTSNDITIYDDDSPPLLMSF